MPLACIVVPATLFVAIVPPTEALAQLAAAVDELRQTTPELRWIASHRWHITLAFLGRADPNEELASRLARVAHRHEPPVLRVAGAGRFGRRVLFAKVDGDLKPLAAGVARAATRAGYQLEERAFRSHLTLARSGRNQVDLARLAAQMAAVSGPAWAAQELRLMRGAQPGYQTVQTWPLSQ
jgi:2'-5' RNA ligase